MFKLIFFKILFLADFICFFFIEEMFLFSGRLCPLHTSNNWLITLFHNYNPPVFENGLLNFDPTISVYKNYDTSYVLVKILTSKMHKKCILISYISMKLPVMVVIFVSRISLISCYKLYIFFLVSWIMLCVMIFLLCSLRFETCPPTFAVC